MLLLPLCPALKRAGPSACAAGFWAFCCLPSLRLCLRLSLRGLLCSASCSASSPAFCAALKRAARLCLLCLLFGSLPASVCLRACLCCRCLRLCLFASSAAFCVPFCAFAAPVSCPTGRRAGGSYRLPPVPCVLRYAFACAAAFL